MSTTDLINSAFQKALSLALLSPFIPSLGHFSYDMNALFFQLSHIQVILLLASSSNTANSLTISSLFLLNAHTALQMGFIQCSCSTL